MDAQIMMCFVYGRYFGWDDSPRATAPVHGPGSVTRFEIENEGQTVYQEVASQGVVDVDSGVFRLQGHRFFLLLRFLCRGFFSFGPLKGRSARSPGAYGGATGLLLKLSLILGIAPMETPLQC